METVTREVVVEDKWREWRLWWKTLPVAFVVFDFWLIYVWILQKRMDFSGLSSVVAATAAVMIGISLALSGLCFFFNIFDRYFFYRKYLGLTGYFFALLYSISLVLLEPERYGYGLLKNLLSTDVIFGLVAMAIFTFMAAISTKTATLKLGPQRWRRLMRLGYLAYALMATRAFILEKYNWLVWWEVKNSLPPVRLLLSIFVVCVILLRLAVEAAKINSRPVVINPS